MTVNIGTVDRVLRFAVGALLVVLALTSFSGAGMWLSLIVGAVLIGTASMKFCPAYRMLGIQTCPR